MHIVDGRLTTVCVLGREGRHLVATPKAVFVHSTLHGQLRTCGSESPHVAATCMHSLEALPALSGDLTEAPLSPFPQGVPGGRMWEHFPDESPGLGALLSLPPPYV